MPEIHDPNLQPRNALDNGDFRSGLTIVMLVFMVAFGFQFIRKPKPSVPIPASHFQPQMADAQTVTVLSSSAGSRPVASTSNFGWLTFIAEPLYLVLRFVHDHGMGNWGWSIVVLTVIFNSLIIWPRVMSMKSSLKMMRIQPKVDAIKRRYAHLKVNDPKRTEMNTEMMDLYKAEGANMFGGCLPLLLQMPLLFAYMSVLRNAAELHNAHWLWLTDLSSPDPLHILPLLIIVSMALTQWITPAPGMSPSQRRLFGILMPGIMALSLWHYASGLSLYWVTGNLINLLMQLAINRSRLGKEMHAIAAARIKISKNSKYS